jgi:undecaprenyl-diphosphatase
MTNGLISFAYIVSAVGSPISLGIISILLITLLLIEGRYRFMILLSSSTLFALILTWIIKNLVERARPLDAIVYLSDYSFPSGHTVFATVFFLNIMYFFWKKSYHHIYVYVSVLCVTAMVLIGMSRIILSVHWVTDVLAGYMIGVTIFYVTLSLVNQRSARHFFWLSKTHK